MCLYIFFIQSHNGIPLLRPSGRSNAPIDPQHASTRWELITKLILRQLHKVELGFEVDSARRI